MSAEEKYNSLKQILKELGKVVIAYSGGVDSTFLLVNRVNRDSSQFFQFLLFLLFVLS